MGEIMQGSKFDPLNQAARAMTPAPPKKEESNPEYQSREMERLVNQLLEESAAAGLAVRSYPLTCGSFRWIDDL